MFFFYRGTETLGPYVVMIGEMLRGDVLKFWVIMSTFLCYFATGKFKGANKRIDEVLNVSFVGVLSLHGHDGGDGGAVVCW